MSVKRLFLVCAVSLSLAACVTPRESSSLSGHAGTRLDVCAGTSVSNAPATDRNGAILGYQPQTNINGVWLFRAPVDACLSSGFGPRRGGASSFHEGIDLYTGRPRAVIAAGDGLIEFVGSKRGYGRTIVIRHKNGVTTRYAHLSSYARGISRGDRIRAGLIIGMTGDSGNATAVHLHYEILMRGRAINPLSAGQ